MSAANITLLGVIKMIPIVLSRRECAATQIQRSEILDDPFISPLTDTERKNLLAMIEDRHTQAATVITISIPDQKNGII